MTYKEAEQLARIAARATRRPMGVATTKAPHLPDGWYVVVDPPPEMKVYAVCDSGGNLETEMDAELTALREAQAARDEP